MNKQQKSAIAIYAIVFVVFNVIFWLVPIEKSSAVIIAYIAAIVSTFISIYATAKAFVGNESVKSKVYGYPVFRMGIIQMVLQCAALVIICAVSCFVEIPAWVAIVVAIVIIAYGLIGIIVTDTTKDVVVTLEEKTKAATKATKTFRLSADSLVGKCTDSELKGRLRKLSEELKYSDPVSCEELSDIEGEIAKNMSKLESLVVAGNHTEASALVGIILDELSDRNRRCKAYK